MTDRILHDENQKRLSESLKISEKFLGLLLRRGIKEEDAEAFLYPKIENMCSPFEIDGVEKAVLRINEAITKKEKILIFGDYDCDGICAVSILMLALRDKTGSFYFIPERGKNGYGLSIDALSDIITSNRPDLVITVDCGVTAVNEVAYLRNNGIDVIITDHHEPQDELPDCIIIDPKIKKVGFYDFCGAGVALKLVEALFGREFALTLIDIAAVATIADVVPLLKDNRIIAYYGIERIKKSPRKGIKLLLDSAKITSNEIMFKLAPKINAAGRLDTAMKAVDLFLNDDHFMLKSLSEELNRDNLKRQEICEQVAKEAKDMLKGVNFNSTRIIILAKESWEAGVLGIAAARLVEEFKCPALLLSGSGCLKGSARSVPGVNIFGLLNKLSDYFISFGGHEQAAGVTLREENLKLFAEAANDELMKYEEDFRLKERCGDKFELSVGENQLSFAKELALLEPTGYGNPKPRFIIKGGDFKFERIGFTSHVKHSAPSIDILGFGKYGYAAGTACGKLELDVTLGVNVFQNRERAQAIINSMTVKEAGMTDEECDILNLHHLEYEGECDISSIGLEEVTKLFDTPFGNTVICFNQSEYESLFKKLPFIKDISLTIAAGRHLCPENCVVLAPSKDFDFSYYQNVVIAGRPFTSGFLRRVAEQAGNVVACCDCAPKPLYISDDTLREVYLRLKQLSAENKRIINLLQLYDKASEQYKIKNLDFYICLKTLCDLRLISLTDRGIINVSNIKVDLNSSAVYRNICKK